MAEKLTTFLEQNHISYEIILHPRRFTAQETAVAEHVSPAKFAKVVMARVEGETKMFVIPAHRKLDLIKVGIGFETQNVEVEHEPEFESLFPDGEIGGMTPFGILYHVRTYLDRELAEKKRVVF